jgi:uncharacterized membrane protein YccC
MKFLLSYLLIDLLGSWIGVLIANVVALGIYCVVQPFVLHRTLKRLDQLS